MFSKEAPRAPTPRSTTWFLVIGALVSAGLLVHHVLVPGYPGPPGLRSFLARPSTPACTTPPIGHELMSGLPTFSSLRVVSLASRPDRRAHMRRLDAYLQLGMKFSDAVLYTDPRVAEIVARVGNHTKADKGIAEVGHVACRMSHRRAIEAAEADDDEITLILEDDVDFEAAFKYLAGTVLRDVPKDWDMIFFGHTDFSDESRHGRDPRTKNFMIYKSIEPQGGHAYALSRKGRKLLLDLLDNKRPDVYETDDGQPIDEIFLYLARLQRAALFSIIPDLVVQRPLFQSDIFKTPAGFDDGMHSKPLLDSTLARIQQTQPVGTVPQMVAGQPGSAGHSRLLKKRYQKTH